MRLHRFYIPPPIKLTHDLWINDSYLLKQWSRVLRMSRGSELVLFDGSKHERLYRIEILTLRDAHLKHITDLPLNTPKKQIYLFWALLKRDKNNFVLQKCTELGVNHFIPLICDRCERTDLSQNRHERWQKILIEAAEQCGRGDIPVIRQPMSVERSISKYSAKLKLFVADQEGNPSNMADKKLSGNAGVLIGPEGGWSKDEKKLFDQYQTPRIQLSEFTLRAETASIIAAHRLAAANDYRSK